MNPIKTLIEDINQLTSPYNKDKIVDDRFLLKLKITPEVLNRKDGVESFENLIACQP